MAEFCNFGDTLKDMLRDRLVCGINDSKIQKCLLSETKPSFQQAMDISQGLETAVRNVKELKPQRGPAEVDSTAEAAVCKVTSGDKHVRKITSGRKPDVVCYRCGKPGHYVSKCRVSKNVTSHQCGKTGHLQ